MGAETYFRAVLTDPQIKALETAADLLDADDREFCERHGIEIDALGGAVVARHGIEIGALGGAVVALQNAEIIL